MTRNGNPQRRGRRARAIARCAWLCLLGCGALRAATLTLDIDGVEGELKDAAAAASGIQAYANREVSAAQAHRPPFSPSPGLRREVFAPSVRLELVEGLSCTSRRRTVL